MKKSFMFVLATLLTLLISPVFVLADDGISISKKDSKLKKFNVEDFVDASKPFKKDDGELVDTLEYFENDIESIAPFVIIGKDGRSKVTNPFARPYKSMTYILLEYDDYLASCSGTLVDNYKILTNAHCLSHKKTGKKPLASVALTGVKDNHYSHSYWGESYHVPSGYHSSGSVELDYGVLVLEKDSRPAPGIENGKLPIKTVTNLSANQNLKLYGYPSDKTPPLDLWGMRGNLIGQTDTVAFYNMDTYYGQSGSGVLNNSNEIVAVHSSGFRFGDHSEANGGPKTTKSVVNFIKRAR